MAQVPAIDDQQVQMNQSIVQLHDHPNLGVDTLGHSEEVETLSIDAMEVDVQVRFDRNDSFSLIYKFLFSYSRLLKSAGMKKLAQCHLTALLIKQI